MKKYTHFMYNEHVFLSIYVREGKGAFTNHQVVIYCK